MRKKETFRFRCGLIFTGLFCLFFISFLMIARVSTSEYYKTANNGSTYSVELSKIRGNIYDRNREKLVESETVNVAAVGNTPSHAKILREKLPISVAENLISRLVDGFPIKVEFPTPILSGNLKTVSLSKRYSDAQTAAHIIGYVDSAYHGVCGIEAAFDELLYTENSVDVQFKRDATGSFLYGANTEIRGMDDVTSKGVILTLDKRIQAITELSISDCTSAAAVVTEIGTGEILALASVPTFNPNDLSLALQSENAPFLNRALENYNVGSVFKLCVAAAALETGIPEERQYNCEGSLNIDGTVFYCYNHQGHGTVDMKTAIAQSCNCYFYQLALETGADAIYNMAMSLHLSKPIYLAEGIGDTKGNFEDLSVLRSSDKALANLSIGQGKLMLSPLSITTLYEAVANNGCYYPHSLIKGTIVDSGEDALKEDKEKIRAMSENTAQILKEALIEVVESGTGMDAKPEGQGAGGKTATAETAVKGKVNKWFCGFYPKDDPKYVISVMLEGVSSDQDSCGVIFKKIAELLGVIG